MGLTTDKGEIGEAEVIADLRRRGHGVAIPIGHSLPFDLVLVRRDTGALERVQVKYTTSDGRVVVVRVLAPLVEPALQLLKAVRAAWRPLLWELAPAEPRGWVL